MITKAAVPAHPVRAFEYNDIVKKEQQVSWEEQMVMLLVKASGISVEEDLGVYQRLSFSDCNFLIERCFEKVQELMLYEKALEEEMLEKSQKSVMKSIDGIDIPADTVFEEPVEKLKWLAGYLNDCQKAKELAEEELAKVREESSDLFGRLAEAHAELKLLQEERQGLAEEKREIETSKENVEKELLKAIEEASSQAINFTEACALKKSFEEALSQAENDVDALTNEKEAAQVFRAAAEQELDKP
ncbi:hypothetical protein NL676_019977 [Syzygium grande]|nr:hypothetical protein NL676_019977 [Syzygium grande]